MSPYTFGGILIAFVAYSSICMYGGYKYATYREDAVQEAMDLKASTHKNQVETRGSTINQEAENAYNAQKTADAALYLAPIISMPASNVPNLSVLPKPSSGTQPSSCISRKYKLTLQQCDQAKDGYIDLWDAWVTQAANK